MPYAVIISDAATNMIGEIHHTISPIFQDRDEAEKYFSESLTKELKYLYDKQIISFPDMDTDQLTFDKFIQLCIECENLDYLDGEVARIDVCDGCDSYYRGDVTYSILLTVEELKEHSKGV